MITTQKKQDEMLRLDAKNKRATEIFDEDRTWQRF